MDNYYKDLCKRKEGCSTIEEYFRITEKDTLSEVLQKGKSQPVLKVYGRFAKVLFGNF